MEWEVELFAEVEEWFLKLDDDTSDLVEAAIDLLAEHGPTLGRPLVDRIKGSNVHNLKELRPGSSGGTEVRILFAFDSHRIAILLVAGDKSGQWNQWYRDNIKIAEDRLKAWEKHYTEEEP